MSSPRLTFPDYLTGDTHAKWVASAPPRDLISTQATIRRDVERLGDGSAHWIREFAASVGYTGSPEELLVAAAGYCTLEGVRLDVQGKQFVRPEPVPQRHSITD